MRRAAVAVFIGGLAFWGIGSGLGHQPAIVDARLTAAVKPANAAEPANAAGPGRARHADRYVRRLHRQRPGQLAGL